MRRKGIQKEEWKLVFMIALAIVLVAQVPFFMGHVLEEDDEVFMGIPVHVTDANNHLNLALQAKEGQILLANRFTGEEVPALLFSPHHLLIGWTAKLFSLDIIHSYTAYTIIFAFLFFLVLYWSLSHFVKERETRLIAFTIIAIASGFGFFWKIIQHLTGKWLSSPDLWVTEMTVFQSLDQPHFMLGLTLLLLTLTFAYRGIEQNNYRDAIRAGAYGFLLTLVHVFDIITAGFILLGWFFYKSLKARKFHVSAFKQLIVTAGIIAPALIYYLIIFVFNPAYAEWNALNVTTTPNLIKIISGFGFIFFFAIIYLFLKRKELFNKNYQTQAFLAVWIISQFILIYLPVNVQRRFIMGLQIPLAILSAYLLIEYLPKIITKIKSKKYQITYQTKQHIPQNKQYKKITTHHLNQKTYQNKQHTQQTTYQKNQTKQKQETYTSIVLSVLLVILSLTNVFLLTIHSLELKTTTGSDYDNVKYLEKEEYELLEYIDTHIADDKIIFSPLYLSNHIPAVTNNKVYCGHWAQTIDYENKKEIVKTFYETGYLPSDIKADYAITDTLQIIELRG